jgi:hypothetical protein
MAIYTYSKARQNLASLLDQAIKDGEVMVKRKDGQIFVIRPEPRTTSPLEVEGVDLDISTAEIVQLVREGREARNQG